MRLSALCVALMALLLTFAQAEPASSSNPVYLLQPGDKLEFRITTLPQLEAYYIIRKDGYFDHPVLGETKAAGRTLAQVSSIVQAKLKRELKNPSFRLGLVETASRNVAILGEVTSPGRYPLVPGSNVWDLLALAGGVSAKADPETAVLVRGGVSQPIRVTPPAIGSPTDSISLNDGDIIYIQPGLRVSVTGEVFTPGVVSLSRMSGSIASAVAAAGGTKPEAALDRAEILRPSLAKSVPIDLRPGAAANLPEEFKTLQDGDMIVVPARQAMVAGAISKPGPVALKGGENLLDVLNGAGGAGGQADVSRVAILRQADVKAGQGKVEEVDVRAVFEGDDKARPLPLIYDGDIVFVPSKNEQDSLGFLRILTTITSLGGLYNIFLR